MYSLHLVAYDKAGNHKVGRNLFLFDDQSVVDIDDSAEHTRCTTASKDTEYTWVVEDTSDITFVWPSRFMNVRHMNNFWLNKVLTYGPVPGVTIYEDLYGNRTNHAIKNVRGEFTIL